MSTPTLYLSNWANAPLWGPGRQWTIMIAPRHWERGYGWIPTLRPGLEDLRAVRSRLMDFDVYRDKFLASVKLRGGIPVLAPGKLGGVLEVPEPQSAGGDFRLLQDGDTLLCGCGQRAAAQGHCHRVWSAALLVEAGWTVVLDGVTVLDGQDLSAHRPVPVVEQVAKQLRLV